MTTDSTANAADLTGRELGEYRVLRRLGAGGMAEVYLAEQISLGRQVALKVLQPHLAGDASYVERFKNEARAAASLVHPNIVQIYDVGQVDGVHFIAQEYIPGKNLGELLQRQRTLEPRLVMDVMRQVTAALGKATELGIVHRDIKPENLMLSHSGEIKVADFGLARVESADAKTLTQVGVAMGTPLYMSPEQIEGRPVDVRSDLYSLGVTCYHLLTGAPPHTGDTALAIAVQHLHTPPRPLENVREDVPSGLARIIHRLMSKKPEQRYAGPQELLAELRKLATEAAEQGWADGPDDWSLAEWIASTRNDSRTAGQLTDLMQQSAQLDAKSTGRIWRIAAVVAALAAGAALGVATRPRFILADAAAPAVEKADTAWGQIYRAKKNPSEAAWLAVEKYFKDADPYILAQAKQGLVRYYLFLSEDYDRALVVLRDLERTVGEDESQQSLQTFVNAGLVIVNQKLGRDDQARQVSARFSAESLEELSRTDRRLFEALRTSRRELGP